MNLIDFYISKIEKSTEREALSDLKNLLRILLPTAKECISYGIPTFRVDGQCVAGFAKFKNHLSFFPFSGSILNKFTEELKDFTYTKSSLHFTPEKPIPREFLEKMIQKRLEL